jgi:hypothetical protein
VIVYSNKITPRLQYITDFIGKEITGKTFELTDDKTYFETHPGAKLNYSRESIAGCKLQIADCGLLSQTGITDQTISCFTIKDFKAFFETEGDYPFDIFAASFYLLSRYEEYLPHEKDMYGRYSHENSIAFKEGFLNLPLVNTWIDDFKKVLKERFPQLTIHYSHFTFIPTYDIDEAYSFKHKGFLRTAGGFAKSFLSGQWSAVKERINVLSGKSKDPFDSFDWMDELHRKYNLQPKYFFLIPEKNAGYDKNILPYNPAMRRLIKEHADKYPIGIHPSWQSGDDDNILKKEKALLENISGKKITASRQHYIRFNLPQGYRRLFDIRITDDYSMGYGSINGFRASVASSFYWYDLKKEEITSLLLHPFCYMEANSFFEQKFTPEQAFDEMMYYYNTVKSVNGTLITLWHNTFLGTDKFYSGWREAYQKFIETIPSSGGVK